MRISPAEFPLLKFDGEAIDFRHRLLRGYDYDEGVQPLGEHHRYAVSGHLAGKSGRNFPRDLWVSGLLNFGLRLCSHHVPSSPVRDPVAHGKSSSCRCLVAKDRCCRGFAASRFLYVVERRGD